MFLSSAFHTFLLSDWTMKPSIDLQILVYVQSALIFVESLYDSVLNCPHRALSLFVYLFVCFVLFPPFVLHHLLNSVQHVFCIIFISVNTPEWNLILFYFFLRQQSIWKEETEVYNDVCVVN